MCASIASLLGFNTETPEAPKLPPVQKAAPEPPKPPPPPKPLQSMTDKPKVDYMKKSSASSKAKRIGASDLRIPLNQQQSNAGTGGLNV